MIKYLLKNKMGALLRTSYACLRILPGGKWLFSKMIGRLAPYTGTVAPEVLHVAPGYAVVAMADRSNLHASYTKNLHATVNAHGVGGVSAVMPYLPSSRNPFNSIHAVAQAGLAEIVTEAALPEGEELRLVRLGMQYCAKARGTLTAKVNGDERLSDDTRCLRTFIFNADCLLVSIALADWQLLPASEAGSIDPIALMNLGEAASGLAFLFGLPDGAQAIITKLSIENVKPVRGRVTARCSCAPPTTTEKRDYTIIARLYDSDGNDVATVTAVWTVSPVKA